MLMRWIQLECTSELAASNDLFRMKARDSEYETQVEQG
jgi:hypothetical protein